jgi:hypothetical protein
MIVVAHVRTSRIYGEGTDTIVQSGALGGKLAMKNN